MKALGPVLLVLISYAIIATIYIGILRHRIKASQNPLQVLPRRKRIAYAEEMLERERQEYEDLRLERQSEQVKRFVIPELPPTHRKEPL